MQTEIRQAMDICPYCGAKIKDYVPNKWLYGSPVRVCGKCGKNYIDSRYHEIAVEGYQPGALSVSRDLKCILILLAMLLISGGILFYELNFSNYYHPMFFFIILMSVIGVIFMLADIIRIKTGSKERALEKLKAESEGRMKNSEYAHMLKDLGYSVPERFLNK